MQIFISALLYLWFSSAGAKGAGFNPPLLFYFLCQLLFHYLKKLIKLLISYGSGCV
jgi:hypothetical protein